MAFKIILGKSYDSYESTCTRFVTVTLELRRQKLCLRFAIKNINSSNCMFSKPNENINLRRKNKIVKEYKCNKTKFQRSSLPYLAKLANSKAWIFFCLCKIFLWLLLLVDHGVLPCWPIWLCSAICQPNHGLLPLALTR